MTKPRVVIVGAGHAGIELTRELKQAAQVVLIDQYDRILPAAACESQI